MARVRMRRVMLRPGVPYPIAIWSVVIDCTEEEFLPLLRELLSGGNVAERAEWGEEGLYMVVHGEFHGERGTFKILIRVH